MHQTSIITWKTIPDFGDLWWQHLAIRKALFVDEEHWEIPHSEEVEWDQYDTPHTYYVITHEDGKVKAASRINPCIQTGPLFSYMIKDATEGKLAGIPATILNSPPLTPTIWEATRFAVDPKLSNEERKNFLEINAKALASFAKDLGATQLLALMPPYFIRWLNAIGLKCQKAGPITKLPNGDRVCVIEMPIPAQQGAIAKVA